MSTLTGEIKNAWLEHEGAVVLTTVNSENIPNSIYATCVGTFADKPVIADNYFDKTRTNILNGSKAGILFITSDNKAYQLKGTLQYHKSGAVFDSMKEWNPQKHPGHAAVTMNIEEVYSGADKLL